MTTKKKATDAELIELILAGNTRRELMEDYELGASRHKRLVGLAARKGFSPEHGLTRTAAPGFVLKGHSDFINEETGELSRRWLKYDTDKQAQAELMRVHVDSLCEQIPPEPAVTHRGMDNDALCNLYTLSDVHFGALAWHMENLEGDWDLKIAEDTVVRCFQAMIDAAPAASSCVINELGDSLHQDSFSPTTPASGHVLAADGRFGKIVETIIRVLRRIVRLALEKHKHVKLLIAEGNHSPSSSVWMRKMFAALYEDEPRIDVDTSEIPYYVHMHGDVMLAFHHGHLKKKDSLPMLFAAQFPKQWGASTKRHCHVGHYHHLEVKDHGGMIVTQHPTLAARDEYASRHGYLSERAAICHTYHNKYGHVASNNVCPEMLA